MAKKKCDICGNEVGFLSKCILKDGIGCSDCLRKLEKEFFFNSESFSLEQIKNALAGEIQLKEPLKFQCSTGYLVLDTNNKVLYMQLPFMQTTEEISINSIIGYSYIEDEKQYGVGRILGGAAVGGVLFGGVGAVVGSVMGANPKRLIKNMAVEITYEKNDEAKIFVVNIYKGKPLKVSSLEYKGNLENAKKLMRQLDLLISC